MPMPIGPDLYGTSDPRPQPTEVKDSSVCLSTTEGIRLSDIVNLRVGCWRPAVHLEPCRRFEA